MIFFIVINPFIRSSFRKQSIFHTLKQIPSTFQIPISYLIPTKTSRSHCPQRKGSLEQKKHVKIFPLLFFHEISLALFTYLFPRPRSLPLSTVNAMALTQPLTIGSYTHYNFRANEYFGYILKRIPMQ